MKLVLLQEQATNHCPNERCGHGSMPRPGYRHGRSVAPEGYWPVGPEVASGTQELLGGAGSPQSATEADCG
jgi:hypothetical protein